MQGIINFVKVHRIFPSQKKWWHQHPLFPVIILTLKTLQGDEIMRWPLNFVTLLKNKFSRPRQCPRPTWPWPMSSSLLYRFQYWKKPWATIRKFGEKNVFAQKYDEIRSFDGWDRMRLLLTHPRNGRSMPLMQLSHGHIQVYLDQE
jgi:hypothetical protein